MIHSRKILLVLLASAFLATTWPALPSRAEDAAAPAVTESAQSAAVQPADPAQPDDQGNTQPDQPKKEKRRLVLMPAFNDFFPTDSKTKSRFGSSWPSLGLALAWRGKNTDPQKIELRLDGVARKVSGASAYIFPIGMGYTTRLSSSKSFTTYAGVSANAYVGKLQSDFEAVDTGWRFRVGAGALVGANIGSKVNVQAAYYAVPSLGGFSLSGLNLSAHIQAW